MRPEVLLEHFERIAEAPDAVERLRRFVLDLAVRGRLVAQDSGDEPANQLLKQIYEKKKHLFQKGNIRKPKDILPIDQNIPFKLPDSWSWIRLGDAFQYDAGKKTSPKELNRNAWLLELEDIEKDSGKAIQYLHVSDRIPKSTKSAFRKGDVLYGKLRPYLNKVIVAHEAGYSTTEIVAIRCYGNISPHYTAIALRRSDFLKYVTMLGQGTKMPRLRTEDALQSFFPLPPLAEQHRIVAKVDELMALCDELAAAQTRRENRRNRLVAATLHSMNNGDSGEDFRENARFYFSQLPRLTARVEHVQQLRQTILILAVRGRLATQDLKDEPAYSLLSKIQKKQQKNEEIKIRISKKKAQLLNEEEPFALPEGWAWAHFRELGIFGRGKSKHRPRNDPTLFEDGKYPFVQTGDVAKSNGNIKTFSGKYNEKGLSQSQIWPKGTICITIAANIADSGILSFDACFPDSVVGFIPDKNFSSTRYFEYFIRTIKNNLLEFAPATAQKNINLGILNQVMIPLPPLPEQHRIVAKVNELMALCDDLETHLKNNQTTAARLLDAALHEALSE